MSIQVLISTMGESDPLKLLKKMNISSGAVLVNQCGYEHKEIINYRGNEIIYLCCSEKGLSRSRNKAITNSNEDISLIADDDLIYVDNYIELVKKAFEENPEYDIIRFKVEGINKHFKKYGNKSKRLGYLTSLKMSSVEIAFRTNKIKDANIRFNEEFGAGSIYRMGEESIFLHKCLQKGLKIKYEPIKIADLYIGDSSWFTGFNRKYFFDRGATFSALSNRWVKVLILQFAIRHYKKYKNEMTFFEAIREMLRGHLDYTRRLGEK
ncbi:glycosyltransferase family A protein [Mangrovibacillus cuniculi]|uniref:Glycosyltransferase family 2 protein n=1 Tax=Mangrovibacillus cuniculi TaxID=2593652 RepID=A0A7S8CCW2_9BACI|nr:glycosyltransferase family A protein [Mangrovibacillus cuniculi]QPC47649.1 glycosyltransferase family 2 protein [Mangrovibacillus cuniculi]